MSPIESLRQNFLSPQRHEPQWRDGLTNEQYHALKSYVSSSSLRKFPKSAKTFFWEFNNTEQPKKGSKAAELRDFGTAFHQAALEPDDFEKKVIVTPKFKGHANSAVGKEERAVWYEEHKDRTILKNQKRFDELRWMMDSLRSHHHAASLLKNAISERSGFYFDPDSGIPCRIREDAYSERWSCISDIKTTGKAMHHRAFQKTMVNERYDISMAMYKEGRELITGKPVLDTAFIVVQTVKPYECAVYPLTSRAMALASLDYHTALADLADALRTNQWAPAQSSMQSIEHPASMYKEYSI